MKTTFLIHPRAVRIWHWINAVVVISLLWTGTLIFMSGPRFKVFSHIIPRQMFAFLHDRHYADANLAWHLGVATVFIINTTWYATAVIRSGTWRDVLPNSSNWVSEAFKSAILDIRDSSATLNQGSYNQAQRVAYSAANILLIAAIISGSALWLEHRATWFVEMIGGSATVIVAHLIIALLITVYVVIHVAQVARAGRSTLYAMITGTTQLTATRTRKSSRLAVAYLVTLFVVYSVVHITTCRTDTPAYLAWTLKIDDKRAATCRK